MRSLERLQIKNKESEAYRYRLGNQREPALSKFYLGKKKFIKAEIKAEGLLPYTVYCTAYYSSVTRYIHIFYDI